MFFKRFTLFFRDETKEFFAFLESIAAVKGKNFPDEKKKGFKWKVVDLVKFSVLCRKREKSKSNGWLSRRVEKAIAAVAGRENEVNRADSAATNQTGKAMEKSLA